MVPVIAPAGTRAITTPRARSATTGVASTVGLVPFEKKTRTGAARPRTDIITGSPTRAAVGRGPTRKRVIEGAATAPRGRTSAARKRTRVRTRLLPPIPPPPPISQRTGGVVGSQADGTSAPSSQITKARGVGPLGGSTPPRDLPH